MADESIPAVNGHVLGGSHEVCSHTTNNPIRGPRLLHFTPSPGPAKASTRLKMDCRRGNYEVNSRDLKKIKIRGVGGGGGEMGGGSDNESALYFLHEMFIV